MDRLAPLLCCAVFGCASVEVRAPVLLESPVEPEPELVEPVAPVPPPAGEVIAGFAQSLVGLRSLRRVTREVPDDCTGVARLSYAQVAIELMGPEARPGDDGVTAIYRHAQAHGAVHRDAARPGDLIFFRETYDRNHDGRRNDGLTHVGVVYAQDPDGTVTFVHRSHAGVALSKMNLLHPRSHAWNDYVRPASRKSRAYLTSELFAGYASAQALAQSSLSASRAP